MLLSGRGVNYASTAGWFCFIHNSISSHPYRC